MNKKGKDNKSMFVVQTEFLPIKKVPEFFGYAFTVSKIYNDIFHYKHKYNRKPPFVIYIKKRQILINISEYVKYLNEISEEIFQQRIEKKRTQSVQNNKNIKQTTEAIINKVNYTGDFSKKEIEREKENKRQEIIIEKISKEDIGIKENEINNIMHKNQEEKETGDYGIDTEDKDRFEVVKESDSYILLLDKVKNKYIAKKKNE